MSDSSSSLDSLRIDRDRDHDRGGGVQRRRALFFLAAVILVGAVGGGWVWWQQQVGVEVIAHQVVRAASGGGRVVLNASGYVVARRAATVSSKITGKVVEILIEEGMQVQAGQVLARLDDTNVRAGLRLAEAELAAAQASLAETRALLEQAEREWARMSALSEIQIASESDLDAARAGVMSLRARLERQDAEVDVQQRRIDLGQQEVEDTIIRAPFSGMATSKDAQPGEMISPVSAGGGFTRTGIGTIVDMGSLEIEVEVNESYLSRVRAGQVVEAVLDAYPDWKIPGKVIAIVPTADRQKATVKVRVGFDELDPRMLPEMGVKVAFWAQAEEVAAGQAVVVPRRSLHQVEGRDLVWLVDAESRVEHRSVVLGVLRAEDAEVTEGLEPGDAVIVEGPAELPAGTKVRVAAP